MFSLVRSALVACVGSLLVVVSVAAQTPRATPPSAVVDANGLTPALARLLDRIRQDDRGQLAISHEDGRFLRMLVAASRSTRVLEIGGASGYSAIWMALGLRETGGTLVTIEYDPQRARELADNVKAAGVGDIVTVIAGDAFAKIPTLQGTFDFVFIDAWKKDYKRFFELVAPRVPPGGLMLAHNVVNKKAEMGDFLAAIEHAGLFTTIVSPSGEGLSISYKRKK